MSNWPLQGKEKKTLMASMPPQLHKAYWDEKEVDLRENQPLTPVESGYEISAISLDLTKACNLRCHYCFSNLSKGDYQATDLTEEMGKKAIDWLMDPGTRGKKTKVDIAFWGGEPLLRWEMMKTLILYGEERARHHNIKVTFGGTTNVTLLTPEKFDFLDKHNCKFLLSIDGRQEHHDLHRVYANGKGSWQEVDKNLEAILERWPDSQVRLSYSVETIETFLDDLKYLYEKGVRRIAYSPVCEGDWNDENIAKLQRTWEEITDWWIELEKQGKSPYLKYVEDSCQRMISDEGNHKPCGAGSGYVGITTDGSIHVCHRFNKFNDDRSWYQKSYCLGHIDYGILNQELRNNFIKWDAEEMMPDGCKECSEYLRSCSGGCWASNWDLEDSLGINPRVHCETQYANRKMGIKLFEKLGEGFQNKYKKQEKPKGSKKLPLVQGCQCYNAEDTLYGRMINNPHDPSSCLCNMAVYGERPKEVERCTCYNIEDSYASSHDQSGFVCKAYQKQENPVEKAIQYLKRVNYDKLNEKQKKEIAVFSDLVELDENNT